MPDSSQITTIDAPISISESRAKPASATDRAESAATASTTIPATFHASVAYSSANPRRSSALRTRSSATATAEVCQRRRLVPDCCQGHSQLPTRETGLEYQPIGAGGADLDVVDDALVHQARVGDAVAAGQFPVV